MVGSSLVHPWFVLGSSLVFSPRQIGKELGKGILIKVLFAQAMSLCDVVSPKGEVVAAELR